MLKLGPDTLDQGTPIEIARNHLLPTAQNGGYKCNGPDLCPDGLGVAVREGIDAAKPCSDTSLSRRSRQNDQDVGPETGDLGSDRRLSALANGHHRNHGADTDDDSEHRQKGSEFVSCQRAERDSKGHEPHRIL
jgi:hypothetical protein